MLVAIILLLIVELTKADLPTNFCVGKDRYNSYPDDCTKYVICIQEFIYEMSCPDPLHWDAQRNKCDWKMEAGCEHFTTTTTTTTPTTTTTTLPPPREYAKPCDQTKCKLPSCRCASSEVPNKLQPKEVPQMIIIAFEDAVQTIQLPLYDYFFKDLKNPNGCPVKATFFVSDEHTSYTAVRDLYNKGHEIGVHTSKGYEDDWRKLWDYEKIKQVIATQRKKLEKETGSEKILGWRNPLKIVTKTMLDVLADNQFMYDSSVSPSDNERWWPYTMDYASLDHPKNCPIPPCRNYSYPGLWELPFNRWKRHKSNLEVSCPEMNTCITEQTTEQDVYDLFLTNFEEYYNDKRVPFNIYGTIGVLLHKDYQYRQNGFKRFMATVLQRRDVYIISMQQAIAWMRQPTTLSDINTFKPWSC